MTRTNIDVEAIKRQDIVDFGIGDWLLLDNKLYQVVKIGACEVVLTMPDSGYVLYRYPYLDDLIKRVNRDWTYIDVVDKVNIVAGKEESEPRAIGHVFNMAVAIFNQNRENKYKILRVLPETLSVAYNPKQPVAKDKAPLDYGVLSITVELEKEDKGD